MRGDKGLRERDNMAGNGQARKLTTVLGFLWQTFWTLILGAS